MNESAWTLIGVAVVMVIVIAGLSMISPALHLEHQESHGGRRAARYGAMGDQAGDPSYLSLGAL